jgi:hypothetical protein
MFEETAHGSGVNLPELRDDLFLNGCIMSLDGGLFLSV